MLRLRLFLLLAGCLFLASATLADDIGYVDCSGHPDGSQIYGKARQSTDIVGSVPCGERFIVLLYGFIFSRIQTSDSKVGYVLSSMISIDHSTAVLQRTQPARIAVATSTVPATPAPAQPAAAASVQVQVTPAQPAQAQPEVTLQSAPASAANTAPAQSVSAQVTSQGSPSTPAATATSTLPQSAAMVTQSSSTPPADSQLATAQPASATATSATSAPTSDAALPTAQPPAPIAQPTPPAAALPDPSPSQPATAQPSASPDPQPVEPIRSATVRQSWEQPRPAGRSANLIDLYGGFAFARYNATSSSSATNLVGGLGAFGYNLKSWLQIVGDTSFNYYNSNGYKYVMYGNHYGVRYFYRRRHLFGITPFAEGLVGGSRLDTTYSGTKTSVNCISYKVGGGLDVHPTRHLEIRLLDVDYYRTSFGTNTTQTSYWATAGIVLRLFGSDRPY